LLLPRVRDWLFYPTSDRWLSILRIGLAVQLLLYVFSLRSDWNYLLGGTGRGLVSRDLAEALLSLESWMIPRFGWFIGPAKQLGIDEAVVLSLGWYCLTLGAILLLIGLYSRAAAVASWFLYLCSVKSGGPSTYGVDALTTTALFYLMLSPLPDRFSLDHVWRKKSADSQLRGFWQRVLQLHLCLIYFFSGLTKALGQDWWNGVNLWRSLIRPPFDLIPADILVRFKYFFPIAGVAIFLLEIGYAFLIWRRGIGRVWLIAVLIMHIGIGFAMGMYLFASVMIVLNLAAFGPGRLWREKELRGDVSLDPA
jgi:Vitamin K-dependent gamma-carboxylase